MLIISKFTKEIDNLRIHYVEFLYNKNKCLNKIKKNYIRSSSSKIESFFIQFCKIFVSDAKAEWYLMTQF